MGKKKKFIDKKNSITFKLVERSQNDPLFVDETAPQYVLVEKKSCQEVLLDENNDEKIDKQKERKNRREEQIKYGIYFDDDYNYLQHLMDVDQISIPKNVYLESKNSKSSSIMLPSSVFESNVVEREDLSKKAALPVGPQLDWDPDIVEAMEDDFDFDDPNNQLNDDFVVQAMQLNDSSGNFADDKFVDEYNFLSTRDDLGELDNDDKDLDDNLSVCGYNGSDDENDDDQPCNSMTLMAKRNVKRFLGFDNDDNLTAKTSASTHFTEYSISSSVLPRNSNLKTLDERFEKMYIHEYANDLDIGALNADEINGDIDPNNSEILDQLVDDFQQFKSELAQGYKPNKSSIDYIRHYLKNDTSYENEETSSDESEKETIRIVDTVRKGDKDRFDCESILSTNTNTFYQPTILDDFGERKIAKQKPINLAEKNLEKQTNSENVHNHDDLQSIKSNTSRLTELSVRPKKETTEERRQRKKELKEYRAQRRAEKKCNRLAFNTEKIRMQKVNSQKKVSVL